MTAPIEYHLKHRPTLLKEIVGQPEAVRVMVSLIKEDKIPHVTLFTGPSGCGKTTAARILKDKLGCAEHDFTEVNCAEARGIDMVRDIKSRMGMAPIGGKCRVWLLDEVGKLTGDAQSAILKILEDTPSHVYFMLATTDPQKLLKTIHTRCTEIKFKSVEGKDLKVLLQRVLTLEGKSVTDQVVERIIEVSEGSPRKALVILNGIVDLKSEDEQLDSILSNDVKKVGFDLAKMLMDRKTKWKDIANLLLQVDEEPEAVRRVVLGYASSALLKGWGDQGRAYLIIQIFRDDFFSCGKPGLVGSCYEIFGDKG
jgi:DNA polymerase III gamma/tau subunit